MAGRKTISILSALVVALVFVGACGACAADDASKILVTVGREKITQADLDAKVAMLPPQFRSRYETPEGKEKLLEQTIKFSLLSQEARSLGIDKQDEVAKKIKEITDNIIIQELTKQQLADSVAVSDAEIAAYYRENKQTFVKPEKIKARLIMFELQKGASADEIARKKKLAQETLKRINKGADFAALAKELSEDRRTKKRGGSTGFFARGKREKTYGKKFESVAFALKKGAVSDVFETEKGFFIVTIVDKKERDEQSLEAVKKKIERRLQQSKRKETYEAYVEGLKKKYPVTMSK